jgi:transmembrane sensor
LIVRTGDVETRVLGTAFDVQRYDTAAGIVRIVVTSGRVLVRATSRARSTPSVVLTAGMIGVVDDSTVVGRAVANVHEYVKWTNGELIFHKTSVAQMLAVLERWYGYRFQVRDSALAHTDVNARFANSSASDMLRTLQTLLDVSMTFDGNVVTLHPRASSRAPSSAGDRAPRDVQLPFNTEVGRR